MTNCLLTTSLRSDISVPVAITASPLSFCYPEKPAKIDFDSHNFPPLQTMAALVSTLISPIVNRSSLLSSSAVIVTPKPTSFQVSKTGVRFSNCSTKVSNSNAQSSDDNDQNKVQELRVPNHWLDPSKAAEVFVFLFESQNYVSF